MLALNRKLGQSVVIADVIRITGARVESSQVRLSPEAGNGVTNFGAELDKIVQDFAVDYCTPFAADAQPAGPVQIEGSTSDLQSDLKRLALASSLDAKFSC